MTASSSRPPAAAKSCGARVRAGSCTLGACPSISASAAARAFLDERHLATLTTLRADGSPHVVAVGFTWDSGAGLVRVITSGGSVKARNAGRGGRAAVCQVDGRRWLTLEGTPQVLTDAEAVADAEQRYGLRYRQPRPNPQRVVVVIDVDRRHGLGRLIPLRRSRPRAARPRGRGTRRRRPRGTRGRRGGS